MRESKETLWDLYFGIGVFCILIAAVGVRLAEAKLTFVLGVAYGGIIAVILASHMYESVEKAIYMDEEGAKKYTQRMAVIRMWIMLVAIIVAMYLSDYFYLPGVVLGILTLKASAYLQPIIHRRITSKFYKKGGRNGE